MKNIIITSLSEDEKKTLAIDQWPVWEKEVSEFDWEYSSDEECLILEGEVEVDTPEGTAHIKPGDFVTFKKGLKCYWKVKKPVRKHYRYS